MALTLLDLLAAFDTIDHTILLGRLQNWFGISGHALNWLSSFLMSRSQQIKLEDMSLFLLKLSFPLVSPKALCLDHCFVHTTPASQRGHPRPYSILYADDSQLYISIIHLR